MLCKTDDDGFLHERSFYDRGRPLIAYFGAGR